MGLDQSSIHRHLDNKFKIVGLEAHDLLLVLLVAAINNLIFGNTPLSFYLVFIFPTVLGLILFYGKRGKPEKYLVHLTKYYLTPGTLEAGTDLKNQNKMKKKIILE